jgi:hypothetical protein
MVHIALELTWSTTREDELPVMTLGDQTCIAVIKRRGKVYTLEPTIPSRSLRCEAWNKVLEEYETAPIAMLPLKTQVQWRIDELSLAQSRGVYFADGDAHMRRPRDPLAKSTACTPLVVMPMFQHQALVCVQTGPMEVSLWDDTTSQVRFVTRIGVRELFNAHEPMRWTLQLSAQWIREQVDITPLSREDDEIHVVQFPDDVMQFWVVTGNGADGPRDRFFFNSRAHLKFALNANQGIPLSNEDQEAWVERRWLFGHDTYRSLEHANMFERMHRQDSAASNCSFFIYKDEGYAQARSAYQRAIAQDLQMQQAQTLSSNATLQQSIATRIRDTRTALERTEATREILLSLTMQSGVTETFVIGAAERQEQEHCLGVLVHHTDVAQWLRDGHYRISFCFHNNIYSNTMDWATTTLCTLREGRRLYLRLTNWVYRDIRSKLHHASLADARIHHTVMVERNVVLLECYYVLGAASRSYYDTFDDLVVDVVILVHRKQRDNPEETYDDKNGACKFFYQVKVKDDDNIMLLLDPIDGTACAEYLVCKSNERRIQENEDTAESDNDSIGDYVDPIHRTGPIYWD